MEQEQAREILASLPSLYNLQDYEQEAIQTIIEPRDYKRIGEEDMSSDRETSYLVCPNCGWDLASRNFCNKCGQPLVYDED